MTELKECPFCGSTDVFVETVGNWWVECNQCEAAGPRSDDKESAIEAWNNRK